MSTKPKRQRVKRDHHYPPALMGREEAARYLAISDTELDNLVKENLIPRVVHRLGGHPKFKRADLDQYVEEMRYQEQ